MSVITERMTMEMDSQFHRKVDSNRFPVYLSLGYWYLLGCLLVGSAMAFSTVSYGAHDELKSGGADYKHYPHGGGLVVGAAFGPDGRLWRVVPEKWHVYVDYSTDLGKTFSAPARINPEKQRIKVSGDNRPGIAV